jgi:hypothetical protein
MVVLIGGNEIGINRHGMRTDVKGRLLRAENALAMTEK